MDEGATRWVEVGPGPVLETLGRQCLSEEADLEWFHSLRRKRGDWETLMKSVCAYHCSNNDFDWSAFFAPVKAKAVRLPTYAFQRKRYWLEPTLQLGAGLLMRNR